MRTISETEAPSGNRLKISKAASFCVRPSKLSGFELQAVDSGRRAFTHGCGRVDQDFERLIASATSSRSLFSWAKFRRPAAA